ncbi:N-acetyltransferase [Streptomyces sp. CB01881]|uniref:GNAT family N-acetyltransferase n=1 Tax=Streptomyces sp. CB01881 TaxID=2078691 RepID=UPI000CDC369E|nr:N-acetyltransferase [Streptomyces sp. CB01881]AUY49125.1 GNAT family N-acetyltransferase [Streptomyces sp. CB01881]TYC77620.1 N-acetyltransferase [Streptomyces sp. CB01881]
MSSTSSWLTRTETPSDVPTVQALTLAAFGRAHEADLLAALRADAGWIGGLSFVATPAADPTGTPVAHVVLSRAFIGDVPALAMGPVSVHPDHQRSGAGSATVLAALDAARAAGERFVFLLGHPTYYPRFGFVRASAHGMELTMDVPDEAWMALSLNEGDPLPSGTARWAAAFGM